MDGDPKILAPVRGAWRRDAFHMLCLVPIERITESLRRGNDAWELRELTDYVNRCRALVAAYDARMEAQSTHDDLTAN